MLRITTQYRAASIQSYFVDALCKDDYYSKGTEQPGIWRGVGAEMLGLAGPVDREAFARLTENRHPFNDERLTPRTKDDRRVGYDITFSPPVPLDELAARIRAKLPPGVFLHAVEEVPLKTEPLQAHTIGADYTILLFAEPGEIPATLLEERIAAFWATDVIERERERKGHKYTYNLRPLVFELTYRGYDAASEEHRIFLRVQQRNGATGRPDEVVDALGFDDFARTLRRDRLYFDLSDEDLAVFAAYPVVEQEEVAISSAKPKRNRRRGKSKPASKQPTGRSINERAADEFA